VKPTIKERRVATITLIVAKNKLRSVVERLAPLAIGFRIERL
jgi:hypothetical protein